MRLVKRHEDRMLLAEMRQTREEIHEELAAGRTPNNGLLMYDLGLRTAAIMLGAYDPTRRRGRVRR